MGKKFELPNSNSVSRSGILLAFTKAAEIREKYKINQRESDERNDQPCSGSRSNRAKDGNRRQ